MEIALAPYAAGLIVGSALLGLVFGEIIRPLRIFHLVTGLIKLLKRKPPEVIVDENTIIRCGACRSIIMSAPIMRTVTDGKDTLIFQCQQCATQVGIAITPTP